MIENIFLEKSCSQALKMLKDLCIFIKAEEQVLND